MATEHYLHFIKRTIEGSGKGAVPTGLMGYDEAPFYGVKQASGAGFLQPMFHVTRQTSYPVNEIKEGDVIWIVSVIGSPWGTTCPCLDAKVVVKHIEQRKDGTTRFMASASSVWFPMKDASKLLATLQFIDAQQQVRKLWADTSKPIGIYLQSIRKLATGKGLERWGKGLLQSPIHFISYRIKDGTKRAFEHAQYLLGLGRVVFWDRFCLPRRLVERREEVSGKQLNKTLRQFIERSYRVYGIDTELYHDAASYAQKEARLAKGLHKFRIV